MKYKLTEKARADLIEAVEDAMNTEFGNDLVAHKSFLSERTFGTHSFWPDEWEPVGEGKAGETDDVTIGLADQLREALGVGNETADKKR